VEAGVEVNMDTSTMSAKKAHTATIEASDPDARGPCDARAVIHFFETVEGFFLPSINPTRLFASITLRCCAELAALVNAPRSNAIL
jgi:hypothetical protein